MADKNLRLQIILEGLDKVTAPLKAITGASSNARKDLAKTAEELKHLGALQKQIEGYKSKESRYAADTKAYQEQQSRLAALRKELEATEKPTKKLRTEFERAEKQAAMLGAKMDAGGADLHQLSTKLSAAGIDVADLARHEDRLAERIGHANHALRQQTAQLDKVNKATANSQKLNDISGKATGAGLGMVAAGTATAAPIAVAVKQAMTLESAMADVSKVTNMTAPQIERLSNDFVDLSTKIPMAANELATIAASAGAAGVGMDKFGKPMRNQREQLLVFTKDAAEMGVAFDMTADQAGEAMAKWRTAFELPQDGVRALGDGVNALTNRFGGKAANVTDIITRIGPLGKVAGLAAPEIAALGSTLDSIGVPSEVAASGIKNTMLALTKGESATKGQATAFETLGLSATDVAERMQKDASGAIIDVMERIKGLDSAKQAGILTQLFGSESVGAIAPMLTNLDGLKQRLQLVGDASATAGSMHGEFLNRIATTEGAVGLAANALSGVNIELGNALLPTVVEVAKKITEAAAAMRGWAQDNPKLAKGLMIFMSAGAGILVLLGLLALAFGALTAAAAPLGIALGPLLLIVAAVAAVAAAAYLIYDNWDAIIGFFAGIWNQIVGLFSDGVGKLAAILLNFSPLRLIYAGFAALLNWLGVKMPAQLSDIGGHMMQGLINGITARLSAVKSTVVNAASSIATWFKEKLGIHSPSRVFAGLGGFVMEGLDQGLAANSSGPLQRISSLADQLPNGFAQSAVLPRMAENSNRIAGAVLAGVGGLAFAAAPATAQAAPGPATGRAGVSSAPVYNITINAAAGAAAQDIAEEVRRALEQIERDRRGRSFGDD